MIHRQEDETWLEYTTRLQVETDRELAMDTATWEATFNTAYPGPGYTAVLRAQSARLTREIATYNAARG